MRWIETELLTSRPMPDIPEDKKHALACELVRRASNREAPTPDVWTFRQSLCAFGAAACLLMLLVRLEDRLLFNWQNDSQRPTPVSELGMVRVPSSKHAASAIPLRIAIRRPVFLSWWQVDKQLSALARDLEMVGE